MMNSLLCPNQIRSHGIRVDNVPKHLAPDPQVVTHSLYFIDLDVHLTLAWEVVSHGLHNACQRCKSSKNATGCN